MAHNEEPVVVSVCCITYNHAKYIKQCLDGIIAQKTSFKYEIIINDDCSTDGTTEIVKRYADEYPELIRPIFHEENQWSKGIKRILATFVYPQAKGKYIALCEGDDYWIDPYKLQKQVAILENNIDCSLVLSNGYTGPSYKDRNIINPYGEQPSGYIDIHSLLISSGGLVPTASMCYRSSLNKMPEFFYDCPVGDKPLRMWCAINGRVFYDNTPQVFYRQNVGGSFTNRVKVDKPYAYYVYSGFCNFLDHFNDYTTHRFASEIDYMKKKEEYMYLFRIKDESRFKCYYFLHHTPLKFRIKKLICYALRIEK